MHRLRLALRVGEREELAGEARAILREQTAHALHVFVEHAEPFARAAVVHAVRVVFVLEPAAPEAEHDASVRQSDRASRPRSRAPRDAGSRRSRRAIRTSPWWSTGPGPRAWRSPPGSADRRSRRRRRSGPRSISIRTRAPRCAARARATPRCSCAAGRRALRNERPVGMSRPCWSNVGRDFGGDEPEMREVVEIEDLQIHGLGSLLRRTREYARSPRERDRRAALARRSSGLCPIAAARRWKSASSAPTHTTSATVNRIVSGSRAIFSQAART